MAGGKSWREGKTTAQRGYGSRWQKARAGFLRSHPLCVMCLREGKTTAAQVVDHIKPHRGNQALFWSRDNWQPLCKQCHDSVKQRQERGQVAFGVDGYPIDDDGGDDGDGGR